MEATPKQDSSPATSNSSSSSTMNGSPAASPSPSSPSTTLSSSPSSSASVLDKEGHTPAEAAQGRPTPHGPSSPPSSSSPSSSSSSQSQSQSSNQQFDHDLDPEGIPEEELKIDLDIVEEELGDDLSAAELFRIFHESCREAKITPWHKVVSQLQRATIEGVPLSILDLTGIPLDRRQCGPLVDLILRNRNLNTLNLQDTQLKDPALEEICGAVQRQRHVIRLFLGYNAFANACIRPLVDVMRQSGVLLMDLTGNDFRGNRGVALGTALGTACRLKVVVLTQTKLNEKAIAAIARALKSNRSILDIHLGENEITDRGAFLLAHMLRINTTLKNIDLRHNDIGDKGALSLAEALLVNKSLSGIVLWNNNITSVGATHLSDCLYENQSLAHLDIGSNSLDIEGVTAIKDSLLRNRTLTSLGVAKCSIGSEGAICVAEALANNSTLRSIDMRQNNIGIAGLMALSLSLKLNHSMFQLAYDVDDTMLTLPKNEGAMEHKLKNDILSYCARNKQALESSTSTSTSVSQESDDTSPTTSSGDKDGLVASGE